MEARLVIGNADIYPGISVPRSSIAYHKNYAGLGHYYEFRFKNLYIKPERRYRDVLFWCGKNLDNNVFSFTSYVWLCPQMYHKDQWGYSITLTLSLNSCKYSKQWLNHILPKLFKRRSR